MSVDAPSIHRSGPPPDPIVVFNPSRQHADELAAGLVESGMPTIFYHGSYIRDSVRRSLAGYTRFWPVGRTVARTAERLLPTPTAKKVAYYSYVAFDRAMALHLRRRNARALIGYEMASLQSFRLAKRRGIPAILDAADVHFLTQDEPVNRFRSRVNVRKAAEIELADYILTCSSLARDSYIAAGVDPAKVHALTLGVDLDAFSVAAAANTAGPLRLAFVGRFSRKKGADFLAGALDRLAQIGLPYECRIAADIPGAEPGFVELLAPHAELLGKRPSDALPALYQWADALVVPSRFDSFGLVVLEALACGLPVITSDQVGAKDFIVPETNGAIFSATRPAELADLLERYARNPQLLRAMRPMAEASVATANWPYYRRAVASKIIELIGGP